MKSRFASTVSPKKNSKKLKGINMSLTSKQRAFLKSEAHTLKPIVQIGKNGLNDHIKTSVVTLLMPVN